MAQVGAAVLGQVSGGASFTLAKSATAGNTLFAMVSYGASLPTLSDSAQTGWVLDKNIGPQGGRFTGAGIWRLDNAVAGTHTITINGGSGAYMVGTLIEYAGLAATPLDVTASNSNTSADVTSGDSGTTAATAQANEVVIAAIAVNPPVGATNDGLTTPAGWTNQQLYVNTTVNVGTSHISKEVSATGTQQAAWTWTEASHYAAVIATYKLAAGGTGAALAAAATASATATASLTTGKTLAASAASVATATASLTTGSSLGASASASASATASLTTSIRLATSASASASASATLTTGGAAQIVSVTNIKQVWQSASPWSPATVNVPQAGDALVVFGSWWAAGSAGTKLAPTDNNGLFAEAVNPGLPSPPPVHTVVYYELNAAVGDHVITPPNIGLPDTTDGNLWIAVVRGLPTSGALRGNYNNAHVTGSALSGNAISLTAPCQIGDMVMATSCYDNTAQFGTVNYTDPPAGWNSLAVERDASWNVPSEVCWRIAPTADTQTVSWTWNDPNVNVTDASIVAFSVAAGGIPLSASAAASATATAALTTGIRLAANAAAGASASAVLTTGITLAASASAAATTSASLTTQKTLSANATAQASSAAALSTQIRLTANASASASATADLTTTPVGLAAAAVASASASATLTTGIALAAVSSASATSSASLTTAIQLAAIAVAQAQATAALTVPLAGLSASAVASSSASAILTTQILLAAQASARVSATADLLINRALVPAPRNIYVGRERVTTLVGRQRTLVLD